MATLLDTWFVVCRSQYSGFSDLWLSPKNRWIADERFAALFKTKSEAVAALKRAPRQYLEQYDAPAVTRHRSITL